MRDRLIRIWVAALLVCALLAIATCGGCCGCGGGMCEIGGG